MLHINDHYLKLSAGYLFPEIARRVSAFAQENPSLAPRIIRCGIGDVTEPLPQACIDAMHAAVDDLATRERFKGYGPPTGHDFLRHAIAEGDFRSRGINVSDDEIFVSDGSKPDASAFLEILGTGNRIAITDPVYPVYCDTNVMQGNTGGALEGGGYAGIVYLPCTPENSFDPAPPSEPADVVYLCSPNNPTGATLSRSSLERWVDWANAHRALICFDAAVDLRDRGCAHVCGRVPQLLEERRIHGRAVRLYGGADGTSWRGAGRHASAAAPAVVTPVGHMLQRRELARAVCRCRPLLA